jgi:protein-S-isoprenylcysteine O-methyltransferase Ste14
MNVVFLVAPILSALAIYWARIAELRTRRDLEQGQVRENLTLRLFVAVGSLMLIGSIVEHWWFRLPPDPMLFVAGWLAAIASFWLRRRAISELGRMWSLHVEIRSQHQLVTSGPYRFVRHPAYTSMFLELVALGLLLQSRFTSALVAVLFVPTLVMRIRIEEAALRAQIPGYAYYQRVTPALLPYKLPRGAA